MSESPVDDDFPCPTGRQVVLRSTDDTRRAWRPTETDGWALWTDDDGEMHRVFGGASYDEAIAWVDQGKRP